MPEVIITMIAQATLQVPEGEDPQQFAWEEMDHFDSARHEFLDSAVSSTTFEWEEV